MIAAGRPEFKWGAATAAFQIEGAASRDGRGPSIWDTFCAEPGRVLNGDTGEVACGHYDRLEEDLDLLQWLGVDAYRFSVSWSRVLPEGTGAVNETGLAFYERLVDGLLARGIEPWLTVYHWDLPQALQDRGGWLNRDSADWFAQYAGLLAERLGDRVKRWITVNEPHCVVWFGHHRGWFAPGIADLQSALDAGHHLLLGHGLAARAIRARVPDALVGFAPGLTPVDAASDSEADVAAARFMDGYDIRWFLDPVYGRGYPEDVIERFGMRPPVQEGDLDIIATPTDFLGVNFYLRQIVAADPSGEFGVTGVDPVGTEVTAMGWEIHPESLTRLLLRLQRDYQPRELFITENGSAWDDVVTAEGGIDDAARVDYLERHLAAVESAHEQGVLVNGYFAWSLMDNFEWTQGYSKRFGLVYVDYSTLRRTPKASAHRYRQLIAESRVESGAERG